MAEIREPSDADLAPFTPDKTVLIDRLLDVIEHEIVPLTSAGVRDGNKVFGGAVLRKSDLSTIVAVTNQESVNPLNHGEIATINAFYGIPLQARVPASETIFVSTHEPCPLCLGGLTWGGWDNFFYLFSYEDTQDAFSIPHDIRLNEEIWRVKDGEYDHKNRYWCAWHIRALIDGCPADVRDGLLSRASDLSSILSGALSRLPGLQGFDCRDPTGLATSLYSCLVARLLEGTSAASAVGRGAPTSLGRIPRVPAGPPRPMPRARPVRHPRSHRPR